MVEHVGLVIERPRRGEDGRRRGARDGAGRPLLRAARATTAGSSATSRTYPPRHGQRELRDMTRREIRSWLMDMDGVLVHEEHASPARPSSSPACASSSSRSSCSRTTRSTRRATSPRGWPHGPRRARGGDLDLRARHRAVPRGPAPGRLRVRDRRGGPHHRAARPRLHAHRARPRLRGARRDAHLQLRAHHAGDPPDRGGRALHRHEPRQRGPDPGRPAARRPAPWPR